MGKKKKKEEEKKRSCDKKKKKREKKVGVWGGDGGRLKSQNLLGL